MRISLCPHCGRIKSGRARTCMRCRDLPPNTEIARNLEIYRRVMRGMIDGDYYQADAAREYGLSRQRVSMIMQQVDRWIAAGRVRVTPDGQLRPKI